MDATVIRAPATLAPGQLPFATIVEIYGGASVSMSRLTVAGPGAVCGAVDENGDPVRLLRAGVQVHFEAHLDFGHAAVRDLHNTPMAQRRNTGGHRRPATARRTHGQPNIHHAEVTDYGAVGVVAFGAGSWANVTHSLVAGPGHEGGVPTTGINLTGGAVGRIAHNTVSGNICPDGMPEDCGPDFFSQTQHAGIVAAGPGRAPWSLTTASSATWSASSCSSRTRSATTWRSTTSSSGFCWPESTPVSSRSSTNGSGAAVEEFGGAFRRYDRQPGAAEVL